MNSVQSASSHQFSIVREPVADRGAMGADFIARDRELAELLAGLQDAAEGRGGVFLIAGEPGIGKTALADQVADHAARRGARVLWGRSWEGDGAAPYWAWSQIIQTLVEGFDEATLRALLTPETAHIARLVPQLAERFGEAAPSIPVVESDAGRFHLFDATVRFLKKASAIHPVLLILDDLLSGDRPSLLLLRSLAREVRTSRLLVVATYRDVEATRSPEAVEVLADLVREGHLLSLRGLDREDVRRLIGQLSKTEPWEGKVAAIHETTGGNPLFVREVTRLLAAQDALDRPGRLSVPVPDSVRAVIRRRLALLSATAVQVLSAAAVVGRDFDLVLVGAASDLSHESVLTSVSEAVELGLAAEAAETAGVYRFSHPLVREAIYDGLPIAARTHMHRRVGEAIERVHGASSTSHLSELAYHFTRSAAIGEGVKAGEYARRAGDRAMDAFAYEEAVVQYRRALDALALSDGADPLRRCELLLGLGRAHARAGEYDSAKATFLLAAEIARQRGQPEQLASAALGIGEQVIQGGLVDRQLRALLQEALDHLGPADSALRVRLLARLSLELTFSEEGSGESPTESLSLEALRIARRLGDRSALVDALRARWMARWGPDGLKERFTLAEELLALALETGDRATELIGRAQRATCSLESGEITAADQDIAVHARLAAELHVAYHEWAAATMRAGRALLAGSLDAVEALAEDARSRLPGRSNASLAYLNQISVLRWGQGRLGELRGDWQHVVQNTPQLGFARAWLCLALASDSQEETARRCLADLTRDVSRVPRDGLWLLTISLASLAAANLEDQDAATVLYPLLLPHADRAVVLPMLHPALCLGSVSFYLGILAARVRQGEDAERHFDAAIRANQRLGATPFQVHAYYEYARLLTRRERAVDRSRALQLLEHAATLAASIAWQYMIERIETLRDPAAAEATEPSVATLPAGAHAHQLRREGDYWTFVHEGSVVRLRDSKGLRCLARLLANPGQEILAVDLEAWKVVDAKPAATMRVAGPAELEARGDLGDAGAMLDATARVAYKARLDELRAELAEAERFNDSVRAATSREEIDFLMAELARAVGLGGRDRKAASHAERARLNVTRAIRAVLRTLSRVHPPLARHLSLTIRTGRYCSYTPDPRAPITWET
jgi:hypothetical protein